MAKNLKYEDKYRHPLERSFYFDICGLIIYFSGEYNEKGFPITKQLSDCTHHYFPNATIDWIKIKNPHEFIRGMRVELSWMEKMLEDEKHKNSPCGKPTAKAEKKDGDPPHPHKKD